MESLNAISLEVCRNRDSDDDPIFNHNLVWLNGEFLSLRKSRLFDDTGGDFEWGYGGVGPYQVAVAILLELYGPWIASEHELVMKMKSIIATMPRDEKQLVELDISTINATVTQYTPYDVTVRVEHTENLVEGEVETDTITIPQVQAASLKEAEKKVFEELQSNRRKAPYNLRKQYPQLEKIIRMEFP